MGPATASEYKSKILDLEKQLNGKSSELDRLWKQLAAMQKFVKPLQCHDSPATFHQQPDRRRRTMCPSMLSTNRSARPFSSAATTTAVTVMQNTVQHQVHELEQERAATKDAVPNIDELRQNNAKLLMDIEELQRDSAEREANEISGLKTKLEEAQRTSQG